MKRRCLLILPLSVFLISGCSLEDGFNRAFSAIKNFFVKEQRQTDESQKEQTESEKEEYIKPEPNQSESPVNPESPDNPERPDNPGTPDIPDNPVDPVIPEPVYDEPTDSLEGINESDLSGLYNTVSLINSNYTSLVKGYFNEIGGYDYYRHYEKNYVCDKTSFYTENAQYTLPDLDVYLPICNTGYLNKDNNYYAFSLMGETKEERMNYNLTSEDLSNGVENKKYQDDLFMVSDLDEVYFTENGFTRISSNKYQSTNIEVCKQFISICAPDLINTGFYLTFSRVTIETNPDSENLLRIRLYVASTQIGKLIDSHTDQENKPNWYLLFSEALISDVGTTTFAPASSLLS